MPVIVRVLVPTGVDVVVEMVNVDVPDPVTEAGLKFAVTPEGKPLTAKATMPAKPLDGLTVAV